MQRLYFEKLTAEELPSRSFLNRIHDLALTCSRDGRVLEAINRCGVDFFGWTAQEITQFTPWWHLLLSQRSHAPLVELLDKLENLDPLDRQRLAGGPLELEARNAGGTLLPIHIHSLFATPDKLVMLARYSIEETAAEEMLRQTQARFRSIVDSLSINLILKDLQGRRVYANQAYLTLRNYALSDIVGKTDAELFPPDIAAGFQRDDQEVLLTGKVLHKFEENVATSGERTWTEVIKGPLRDADEQITGVQILFWDATERKKSEQAFERERYLLHALLDNIPDSIYFKDCDSRFLRISRGMSRKFQLDSPEVAIGKTDADIFTEEHAAQARRDELQIMETGEPMVSRVERETWPDRPDTWCSTTKMTLRDASGTIVGTFGISRDITELIAVEQQLREARDAADHANQAKSDFLANMSHEIRTPMNGVIGMAELLRNTPLNDAQRSFLEMIDQSAHSLLRIINDILDFSKIEAGKLDLESLPFDLRQCVSHAAKSLAARAAQNSVEMILELDPDVPERLVGDAVRLRQVLVNLVGNAIKYTEDGEITIRVSVADGPPVSQDYTLHFAVTDTGIGIPLDKQAKIFEAFSQADVSTTRQYGGTGLGLSISGQLVEMMRGRIWLESEVEVGSTFHFTACFPTAEENTTAVAHTQAEYRSLKGMSVLIVDDNQSSRETLRNALRRRGLQVTAVGNAVEARRAYQEFSSDRAAGEGTLIVDQVLAEGDGLELITELHALTPKRRPITILLSTAAQPVSFELAGEHQIDVVLQKPALQSEICSAIRRVLNHETTPHTGPETVPPQASSGLRFLLAEDGAVNRAVFVGLLEAKGHHVTSVEDGQAAVEAWRQTPFSAIFMDVQMPVLDGLEATRMIRHEEQASGQHILIIAITAAAMESDYLRCLEAGMDDYLSKPVDFAQLDRLLNTLQTRQVRHPGGDSDSPGSATPTGPRLASNTDPTHIRPATGLPPHTSTSHASTDSAADTPVSLKTQSQLINLDAPLSKLKCTQQQHRQLVLTLEKETQQRLSEVSQALDNHDDKLLVRASHSLRSAAGLFEAHALAEVAARIEEHARAGQTSLARSDFSNLRQAANAILAEIQLWLSGE